MSILEILQAAGSGGIAGGATGAAVVFLTKTVLTTRIQRAIQHEYDRKLADHKAALADQYNRALEEHKSKVKAKEETRQTRWEIKRDACLDALQVVDGFHANLQWDYDVEPQEKPRIDEVRRCYNRLALSCDSDDVLQQFKRCLGVTGEKVTGDMILDLRTAIRQELEFGKPIDQDREIAWIGCLNKPGD